MTRNDASHYCNRKIDSSTIINTFNSKNILNEQGYYTVTLYRS